MGDGSNHKKAKGTKKCVIMQKPKFENYKIACLIRKLYIHHRKDLKAMITMCRQKR